MTVLVVDDSLTVRMDLADALEAAGMQVAPVATLAEARARLASHAITAVILDVRLPDGDGVTLLEEIRNSRTLALLPVLMLSSESEVADRIRGLRTGANDYLGKPYDTAFVIARVRELSGAAPMRSLILLVDDSPTFRATLAEALAAAGYATITASDGAEGLRLAAASRPQAIVVDGVMPVMDGATVIRRIRLDPTLRATPCVLLTGSEDAAAELRALDAGADAFVRKESDLEVILARLGAVLRSAGPEPVVTAVAGPRRILAVDDSATYLDALGEMLRDEGHDVVLATSGEEALELLAVQHVDCILLDRLMPNMSGDEVAQRIKQAPSVRDVPLIMLTAQDGRDAMIGGLASGADDFISKSAGLDVLAARVRAQIRRKQFEDEHRRVREQLLHSRHEADESRIARELAETRAAMAERLHAKNRELEIANEELVSFGYSVSHDLRAPLRAIRGFSQALTEDCGAQLDERGTQHLARIVAAAERMTAMVDDLLQLSRVTSMALVRSRVDLGALAGEIASDLRTQDPARDVAIAIEADLVAEGDPGLLRTALENLLGNAWKFTAKRAHAHIAVGREITDGRAAFFVRDDGAGFHMASAERLFRPFQRLHGPEEFEGTGIGLATVHRVIARHGGAVWARAEVDKGATIYFSLP